MRRSCKWLLGGLLIILLAACLRFYQLDKTFIFTLDEEYQSALAQTIVRDFHIIWVGVSASIGFYLGPYLTYLTALLLFLSHGDPTLTGYFSATVGVVTTGLICYFGSRLFSQTTGLLAALLYACLPLIVYFDQRYWNPSLVTILSLLIFVALTQIRQQPWWWLVITICVGAMLHTHLALVAYLPIIAIVCWFNWRAISPKIFSICFLIFVIFIAPLLVFDYYHHFSNLTFLTRLSQVTTDQTTQVNPTHKLQALFAFFGRLMYLHSQGYPSDEAEWSCSPFSVYQSPLDPASTYTQPHVLAIILCAGLLALFVLNPRTYRHLNTRLLAISLLVLSLGFIFYPGIAPEYYLLGAFPLIVLILGRYHRLYPVYLLLAVLGAYTVFTAQTDFGLASRKLLVQTVMAKIGASPFVLLEEGGCHKWQGWRYLFSVFGRAPERSSVDNSLGWLYTPTTTPAKYNVITFDTRSGAEARWSNYWAKIEVGGYTAVIYVNRN